MQDKFRRFKSEQIRLLGTNQIICRRFDDGAFNARVSSGVALVLGMRHLWLGPLTVGVGNEVEMVGGVRIIKHEVVPQCGNFEVRFADGTESKFFYWDDLPSRRLRRDMMTSEQAREKARAFARERVE